MRTRLAVKASGSLFAPEDPERSGCEAALQRTHATTGLIEREPQTCAHWQKARPAAAGR
jgi:hypothetical protein